MLVSQYLISSVEYALKQDLDIMGLYDIIFAYIADGKENPRERNIEIGSDLYFSFLANTLQAIREYDNDKDNMGHNRLKAIWENIKDEKNN